MLMPPIASGHTRGPKGICAFSSQLDRKDRVLSAFACIFFDQDKTNTYLSTTLSTPALSSAKGLASGHINCSLLRVVSINNRNQSINLKENPQWKIIGQVYKQMRTTERIGVRPATVGFHREIASSPIMVRPRKNPAYARRHP